MRITDLHEDIAYASQRLDVVNGHNQSSIAMLQLFDSAIVLSSIFPYFPAMLESNSPGSYTHINIPDRNVMWEQINFHFRLEYASKVRIVRKPTDLEGAGVNLALALEGADALSMPEDIFHLSALGLFSIGLAWNYDNKFCASYLSKKDYGLTSSGEALVGLCRDTGVAIDMAHASQKTIEQVLELDHGPVFISHGNSAKIFDHPRNYPDRIIEKVVEQGGIIGVTGIPSTLGGKKDIDALAEHIDYMWETFGQDSVAIGSDFLGVDTTATGFESVENFKELDSILGYKAEQVLWKNGYRFIKSVLALKQKNKE